MTACRTVVMTAGISVAVAVFTVLWFSTKKKKKPSLPSSSDKHNNSIAKEESLQTQVAGSEEQLSVRHKDLAVEEISANTFSAKEFSTASTTSAEGSLLPKKEASYSHLEPSKSPELFSSTGAEKEEIENAPLQNEQNEIAAISVTTKSPEVEKLAKPSEEEASTKEVEDLSKEENASVDNTNSTSGETSCKEDGIDASDAPESCTECEKNTDDDGVEKQVLSSPLSSAVPAKVLSNDSDLTNCSTEHKLDASLSDASLKTKSIEAEEVSSPLEPSQESSSPELESPNSQEADNVQSSSQRSSSSSMEDSSVSSCSDGSAEDKTRSPVGNDGNCGGSSDKGVSDSTNNMANAEYTQDQPTRSRGASSDTDSVQAVSTTSDWGTAVEELERKNKQSPKTRKSSPPQEDSHKSPSPTPADTALVSPGSEVSSEVSNDSGRSTMDNGAASTTSSSTHQDQAGVLEEEQTVTWKINFPSDLCGRLIGKQGRNIKWLMDRTGCNIYIRKTPGIIQPMQPCYLEGTQSEVDHALDLIGRKFPTVDLSAVEDLPENAEPSDISQRCSTGVDIIPVLPPQLQLQLTEGLNDVLVCNIMDASHVFVQQHIHPTFPALATLDHCMAICYADQTLVPGVPKPVDIGVICVAPSPMVGAYCRAEVREVMEDSDSVVVKFCDYGGYYHVPRDVLRQIRSDFMTLPFQAVECYLANIAPLEGEENFSLEATGLVEEMTQGVVTQVNVVGYSAEGCPLVHLYSTQADTSIMVNRVLVEQGFAQWLEG